MKARGTGLLLALGLGACSPYEYSKEVTGFSTGVDQIKTAVTSGYANLAADRLALLQLELLDTRAPIELTQSCPYLVRPVAATKAPCLLLRHNQAVPSPTELEVAEDHVLEFADALAVYAKALAAVTNAADRDAYDAAAKRLAGNVQNLAKAASGVAPGADAIAPAVVNLVAWVVGAALDKDRVDTLARSVHLAKPLVGKVAGVLKTDLKLVAVERIKVLKAYTAALAKPLGPSLSPAAYKERFAQAEAARIKLDAVRHSSPEGAVDDLVKSHDALIDAVDDPKANFAQLISAVSGFEQQATALRDALAARAK